MTVVRICKKYNNNRAELYIVAMYYYVAISYMITTAITSTPCQYSAYSYYVMITIIVAYSYTIIL
jgi:hypothetical protein